MSEAIEDFNQAMREALDGFEAPAPPEIVTGELIGTPNTRPLIDSDWTWTEQTLRLKAHKAYANGHGAGS